VTSTSTTPSATNPKESRNNRENEREKEKEMSDNVYGVVKEDFVKQPFKNAENALRDALNLLSQEDW
jgi:hypothetical protein